MYTPGRVTTCTALLFAASATAHAATPALEFTPLTATRVAVAPGEKAVVQYRLTNQSPKTHTVSMRPVAALRQITTDGGCVENTILANQQSCVLTIEIDGSALKSAITGGPIVCLQGNGMLCFAPAAANNLAIQPKKP